ncbi:CRP-like cAMP-activated global transcriptional regulator [Koleobacter methoxysyntrophicus]|jgi:CRP/FNR family transcriptional regulator|uniref:CRP-like cAMP-activated global transcriptional regulator n=2 Tax=Koleobacter methoxysyntrophicus TaxID=2751313 RepID=A0A8A0RQP6_9FIRM|nr:CRP-like cAMP-activated global transcriptional regulator [Koleobacter methoxysyntrophicus]
MADIIKLAGYLGLSARMTILSGGRECFCKGEPLMSRDNLIYLKNISLFSGLSDELLQKINDIVIVRDYKKNTVIFMEGEPGEALFFIKAGKVKITKMAEDGREHILHFFKDGDVFAEIVLFTGDNYPATAETIEDSKIGIIKNNNMERLIRENPDISLELLKLMSRRLQYAQEKVKDMAFKDTTSRMAKVLLGLAERHGKKSEEGIVICLKLTHQELAGLVGITRETATRILNSLKKSGIIDTGKKCIVILDKNELQKLSQIM